MGTVNELLALARKQIGISECPPDSNNVRYNTWYYGREVMGSAYPWCMVFCQWVFDQSGVKLPLRTASCGELMRAAKASGIWVTTNFQPGDVVIYDFSGKQTTTEHCGIVEMELPGYGVQAIEGNTSQSGSQSNGGMVCRKNRASKYIIGAVRPQFDAEKEDNDMVTYKTLADVPESYQKTIRKLMEKGALKGCIDPDPSRLDDNVLNISEDFCRMFTVLDNLGKLD